MTKRLLKERQRIVVLDDDTEFLNYLKKLFISFSDCDTKFFKNASNGFFSFIKKNYVDLYVMDINLGSDHIDGIEITRKIIENEKGSIFLFISGYGYDRKILDQLNGKCVYDYLTKPFDHQEIIVILSTLLNISSTYKDSLSNKDDCISKEDEIDGMRSHYRNLLEEDKLLIKRLQRYDIKG